MTPAEKVEVLRAACCIAGADQNTSDSEHLILKKMAKEIGVGQASLDAMINRSESDPKFHLQQFEILKADPTESMAVLLQVAMADGNISEPETVVLTNLASNLGMSTEAFNDLLAQAKNQ